MSQDMSRKSSLESSAAKAHDTSYTSLIEDHAAQLIDSLFQDLAPDLSPDQPLDRHESAQSFLQTVRSESYQARSYPGTSSQSASSGNSQGNPQSNPSNLALRIPPAEAFLGPDSLLVPYVEMEATLDSLYPAPPEETLSNRVKEGLGSKILLGIACFSFVGSVGLWIGTQLTQSNQTPAIAQAPVILANPNQADIAFAEDLKQSLAAVRSTPDRPTPELAPLTESVSSPLTPQLTPGSVSQQPNSPTLNFPVRTPPTPAHTVAMPNLRQRTLAKPPVINRSASTVASANSMTAKSPTKRLPTLVAAVPSNPSLPTLTPPLAPPVTSQGSTKAGITVQGILDLGDKSAILVARNGSTQNVRIGEVLDSSGWIFLRVENGQAVIQRGSEVRSVSGGEQF